MRAQNSCLFSRTFDRIKRNDVWAANLIASD